MIKFIHAADIHLDSPLHRLEAYEGAPVAEIRGASRRAFENLIAMSLAEAVDLVIIAGDLFDGDWKDYNTGLYFVSQMRRLSEAGIPVFIASGNHDAANQMSRDLPYPENVTVFSHREPETRILEACGMAVHGQSFARPVVTENLAAGYPTAVAGLFNIGVLHTSVTGREGHEPYAPCSVDDLRSRGYDYWALGHAHQFEIISQEPAVVFSGCLQGRQIRETGPKGCVLVTVDDGAPPQMVHTALDVIRWHQIAVDVSGCDRLEDALDTLRSALETAVAANAPLTLACRVNFTGRSRLHGRLSEDPIHLREAVRAAAIAAAGEAVWIEKTSVTTRPISERPADDTGPLGELERHIVALREDPDRLASLEATLSELTRKLPPELRGSEEGIHPEDPAWLARVLTDAHALLAARLQPEDPER